MAAQQTLIFLYNLFGLNGPLVPIWGDDHASTAIAAALASNLCVSEEQTPHGFLQGPFALQRTIEYLIQEGTVPIWASQVNDLPEDQYNHYGFEDYAAWKRNSITTQQEQGSPPYRELNIPECLFMLRRVTRCREIQDGNKYAFQLGVLTCTIRGNGKLFEAQVFPAADSRITHTVWLYRYCIFQDDGHYQEHWRAFRSPAGGRVAVHVEDSAAMAEQPPDSGHLTPQTPQQPQTPRQPQQAYQAPPATRKRKAPVGDDDVFDTPETSASPSSLLANGRPRERAKRPHKGFIYSDLTIEEMIALEPTLIQGDLILELGNYYSNKQIYEAIGRHHPRVVASANVITKRMTSATKQKAMSILGNGRKMSVQEIEDRRQEIKDKMQEIRASQKAKKDANGVENKQKVITTAYEHRTKDGNA